MSKSKRDKRKAPRNPIKVAMDLRYGTQQTTHQSGERRAKDRRAKARDMQED